MSKKKKNIVGAITVIVVLAMIVTGCGIYLNDFYRADTEAIEAFASDRTVEMKEADGFIVCSQPDADTGLIFYPGGKVEHTAYVPLMQECASRGILCVLVEMPFNLAVFDINAADGITEQYPDIDSWYIGGHSLGGSMAASYAAENSDIFEGLVLLGSYSAADLSETSLRVLSVYGSEDMVMNGEKYEECRTNLPDNFTETVIENGCHAYFGMYGEQEGDGTPAISNEQQIIITADAIKDFTYNN